MGDKRWVPLRQAAAILGVSKETVRQRAKAGELDSRRDNRDRILVLLPVEVADQAPSPPGDKLGAQAGDNRQVETLERLVAEQGRTIEDLRAERDKLLAMLDATLAEHRERHRPWPGLRRWWRRIVEGEE